MEDWEGIPKQTDLVSFGLLQTVCATTAGKRCGLFGYAGESFEYLSFLSTFTCN